MWSMADHATVAISPVASWMRACASGMASMSVPRKSPPFFM
jgi:hypothetical protein